MASADAHVDVTTSDSSKKTEVKSLPKRRQGKGAMKNKSDAFQHKKNHQTQAIIQATMLRRLGITDPTNVSSIQLQSAIIPTAVPVSFIGLPGVCQAVWSRMKAIGTRPFANLATTDNHAIFLKGMLHLAESKLAYAQMRSTAAPTNATLSSMETFSEMQLRVLKTMSSKLPYPLVMYLEAIGNFTVDNQNVVPVLARHSNDLLSGVFNFAPTKLVPIMHALRDYVPLNNATFVAVGNVLSDWLPGFNWEYETNPAGERISARIHADTLAFWSTPLLTAPHRDIFLQIVASMESKKDFLLMCDLSTGAGSSVQAVRFPDQLVNGANEVSYYMNTLVPTFEEQVAAAFMLGVDYEIISHSRFVTDYSNCLKHGEASRDEALHALVWAE